MQDLQSLEIFEIEVLELLNSVKVLDSLFFGGGTMLRLCHNLNRYSTDLDFWLNVNSDSKSIYLKMKEVLLANYRVLDSANKKYTLLFEFRSSKVTRNLKIEIRKEQKDFDWERKIAFSRFSNKQVIVKALSLQQMMANKTEAFLSRKLIRDCFDIEFLLMRGVEIISDKNRLELMLEIISNFKDRDFKVTLGSVLEEKDRNFYTENRLKFLQEEIKRKL
ncbi:MAG: nucleotidyl transferase AbiEii/AbiGii toxin family protein [Ignavibacteria bacterium]|nr:nucleotidyl transferase AbiEii/AbiGii toxin family protein [Ignavibacteria bacterium]